MEKKDLWAIACLFCFCCCGGTEKEILIPIPQEKLLPVQFTIDLQKEVLPFPETKSIPKLDIPEPIPQNPDTEEDPSGPDIDPENLYNRIDYIVYQSGSPDILVKHKQFTPQDPDFTIVYDSLPSGNYRICFLAHSDKDISVSGQTALFNKVSDTFHLFLSQKVQAGESVIKNITLQRIVGKIEFISTDTIPKDLKSFTMNISGYQNKVDLTTGNGISQNTPYTQSYTFKDSDTGRAKIPHSFFTFIPTPESSLKVRLTAKNRIDEITRERDINDIFPLANHIIRYTGILYTPRESDDTFTLDILNDGKWSGSSDKDLED
ncbi:FimB/Mfa2 family fimbrial subunit [uncultured Parabacteroides sp.]|uniref:FimB/Mfa2 family fimbrial subunit n=1 Tax=uncultured Parabacteroides sp. TaxID=512312 RepID=UPI00262A1D23|nr:FimB/Mfa2 family fimbrial subunit [uncultured Parabacteroides sp.]